MHSQNQKKQISMIRHDSSSPSFDQDIQSTGKLMLLQDRRSSNAQLIKEQYNSEHLMQFRSPPPQKSFIDIKTPNVQNQPSNYLDDIDIELDDEGNNIAERKEMFEKFYKFDCFLMKNQHKIDLSQNQTEEADEIAGSSEQSNSLKDSIDDNNDKGRDQSRKKSRAFFCLNDVRIDFSKVARNISKIDERYPKKSIGTQVNQPDMVYRAIGRSKTYSMSKPQQQATLNGAEMLPDPLNMCNFPNMTGDLKEKNYFSAYSKYNHNAFNTIVNDNHSDQVHAGCNPSCQISNCNQNNLSSGQILSKNYSQNKYQQSQSTLVLNRLSKGESQNNHNNSNDHGFRENHSKSWKRKRTRALSENISCGNNEFDNRLEERKDVHTDLLRVGKHSSQLVKKFIRIMLSKARNCLISQLTKTQIELVNDLSYFPSLSTQQQHQVQPFSAQNLKHLSLVNCIKQSSQRILKYCQLFLSKWLAWFEKLPVLDPTHLIVLIWLSIQFIFIILAVFYAPLELINGNEYDLKYGKAWIFFKFSNMIIFFCDILLKFNTGVFEEGQIVLNRRLIARKYIHSGLMFDVLALIPIVQTLLQLQYLRFINILILMKVQTARQIIFKISEAVSSRNNNLQNILSLLELLLMICSVCHMFACLFMGIAVLEDSYQLTSTNWMEKMHLQDESVHWFLKYTASLYFAVTTMITVGYGDIVPVTLLEMLFVTFAMFGSCGVFAYSFNQIGDIVRQQNQLSSEFKEEMKLVNRLLEKKRINRDLQIQVRKFLEFRFYAEPQLSMEEETQVMNKLSHHLREKVLLESNLSIINHCQLLTMNFSHNFLLKLALKIQVTNKLICTLLCSISLCFPSCLTFISQFSQEIRISKHEIVFQEEEVEEDPQLFIIGKGGIEVFLETSKGDCEITIMQILKAEQYFGEVNFFKGGARRLSARATDFTILHSVSRSDFLEVAQDFPADFEMFNLLKDNLLFKNKTNALKLNCFVCGHEDHIASTCSKVHYAPDRTRLILQDILSLKQKRTKQEFGKNIRSSEKHGNSLSTMRDVTLGQHSLMRNEDILNYILLNYHEELNHEGVTDDDDRDGDNDEIEHGFNLTDNKENNNIAGYNLTKNNNNNLIDNNSQLPNKDAHYSNLAQTPNHHQNNNSFFVSMQPHEQQQQLTNPLEQQKNNSNFISPDSQEFDGQGNHPIPNTNVNSFNVIVNNNNQNSYIKGKCLDTSTRQDSFQVDSPEKQDQYCPSFFAMNENNNNNNTNPKNNLLSSKSKLSIQFHPSKDLHQLHPQSPSPNAIQAYLWKKKNSSLINPSYTANTQLNQFMQQLVVLLQRSGGCIPTPNSPAGVPAHFSGILSNTPENNKYNPNSAVAVSGVQRILKSTGNRQRSFGGKKRDIIAQLQHNNYNGNDSPSHNTSTLPYNASQSLLISELSLVFERAKHYNIYFPEHNQQVILKQLESFRLRQPEYFGVYSFRIRPNWSKKNYFQGNHYPALIRNQSSKEEDNNVGHLVFNYHNTSGYNHGNGNNNNNYSRASSLLFNTTSNHNHQLNRSPLSNALKAHGLNFKSHRQQQLSHQQSLSSQPHLHGFQHYQQSSSAPADMLIQSKRLAMRSNLQPIKTNGLQQLQRFDSSSLLNGNNSNNNSFASPLSAGQTQPFQVKSNFYHQVGHRSDTGSVDQSNHKNSIAHKNISKDHLTRILYHKLFTIS